MRLVSFQYNDNESFGIVVAGWHCRRRQTSRFRLANAAVSTCRPWPARLAALQNQPPDLDPAQVTFLPVIPRPGKILCVGVNYLAHIREMGREVPQRPVIFVRFADSQVGHGEPLLHPGVSEQFDFEGELAVVIGKRAHRISAEQALDYVAGYSCFNDGSVRDYQRHTGQFTPGKNFHHSGSFGPWLVTADEIPDPSRLRLQTRVSGELMQSAPLSDLCFSVPALLEYCATFAHLEPGDVVVTGTPGGVGAARKPPRWLVPGDTVEVEIDGVGMLRNPVVAAA